MQIMAIDSTTSDARGSDVFVFPSQQVADAVFNQQQKKRTGIDKDPQWLETDMEGRIENPFTQEELACKVCYREIWKKDENWWPQALKQVHLPIADAAKTGPDMHQCFCGYFSFRTHLLDEHLVEDPYNEHAVRDLVTRLDSLNLHSECKDKLVAAMRS